MIVTESDIRRWRAMFPVTQHGVYLFNGGFNVGCTPVQKAMADALTLWKDGGVSLWEIGQLTFVELRQRLARLLHVSEDDIVILDNATSGINLAIDLLNISPAGNVVVTDLEFMTNTYAFLGREPSIPLHIARNTQGRISLEDLEKEIDSKTSAIHISHVTVGNGFRHDLKAVGAMAADREIPLIVDVSQALGVVPVDLDSARVSFAVGTVSKWMLGPAGIGFLYVAKEFQEHAPPRPGWFGAANADDWDLFGPKFYTTAHRFQGGMLNMIGVYGANAGARVIEEVGIETIEKRVLELTRYLMERLLEVGVEIATPFADEQRAGIVFFTKVDHDSLDRESRSQGTTLGHFMGGIRVDPHFYNVEEELDAVVDLARKHLI